MGLTRLLTSLHDPQHVARFQELCGVRGSFTGDQVDADQRDRPSRGQKGKHQDVNGAINGTANGDTGESARARPSRGSGTDGMARGPLRKNSLTGDAGHQFVISNRVLYYAFTLGTELGNELFYISFFPFLTWNVDPYVARRLIAIWVWVMYLGQCTKDLVRWKRPASPPVVKLEVFYDSEYSMPSTHAMSGTAVPLGLFLLTCGRWEYPLVSGLALVLSWTVLVCVSRVYMGMHSVLFQLHFHVSGSKVSVTQEPTIRAEPTDNTVIGSSYIHSIKPKVCAPLTALVRSDSGVRFRAVCRTLEFFINLNPSCLRGAQGASCTGTLSRWNWVTAYRDDVWQQLVEEQHMGVMDVIAGFFFSLLILAIFYPALDAIDTFNLSSRYAPVLVVSFHAILGLFSFTLDTWSTSRGDTAQILGTGAGIAVASHLNHQLALIHDPPASMLPLQAPPLSLGLFGWSFLRFVLGVTMLFATRAVMKALTIPLVCRAAGISSQDVRIARQNMQVELPYRYIVYWTVGFSAFFLVPFIFSCVGLY
ncbi:sphingosine-1-phosphate phosphatase 1 isoform X2 [Tachysurus vachellii]|uniref:sphingosine-1-phosphate phosphatase 1 isoform X2 n=1 Tax=Tachysurus vachellii TaxID=175792 RepID=UPI00296AD8C3|nr:sphingosine-1-phosphate phosphatase 1 isoform X2 [Tachysurus vachellii]